MGRFLIFLMSVSDVCAATHDIFPYEGLVGFSLPFFGLLLSLAILPVLCANFWSKHYTKIVIGWLCAFLIPFGIQTSMAHIQEVLTNVLVYEYIPFALLIGSLYAITGNISMGRLYKATPLKNTLYLLFAGLCASVAGTTGAAMIFIRPFIKANSFRKRVSHAMIFFIFIVANIGGALTPLGDPPLFLGYLSGVPFFWPLQNLLLPTIFTMTILLSIFFLLDLYFFKADKKDEQSMLEEARVVLGKHNTFFLLGVIITLMFFGGETEIGLYTISSFMRDAILFVMAVLSYKTTPASVREINRFSWHPLAEVLIIFLGLFILVDPTLAILSKKHSSVAPLLEWFKACGGEDASLYFWGTGLFSSFLDNAPTYLVFVRLTECSLPELLAHMPRFLAAISAGAVFMGAMTYIGNAPNFMVKAIVEQEKVKMPGFLGYMMWSTTVLLPVFIFLNYIFFSGDFPFISLS
ncbi:MAG: sodium:proton antiporter [Alphaproteobacteria bacterium]|nr:sodium:proton antiporter [Alphaproteobacteria bacterium]